MLGGTWGQRSYWKFWYALRTSKAQPGTYFLTVQLVADGDVLRCAGIGDVVIAGNNPSLEEGASNKRINLTRPRSA
jgi:hypothetical protein